MITRNFRLSRAMLTILQLLKDGANPRLVKCPQPAILIAIIAGSSDLVRHLVHFGADVNEVYSQVTFYALKENNSKTTVYITFLRSH